MTDPGYSCSVIEIIAGIFGDWRWTDSPRRVCQLFYQARHPNAPRARYLCYDAAKTMRMAFLGIWRAFAVTFCSRCALVENVITIPFFAPAQRVNARAGWLHRWSRFASRVVGIRVTTRGAMPPSGLLVSNHLSYLDVIVLSSIRPCVFVAKRDVAGWPLFGWLARAAGTIFVDRQH